MYPVTSRFGGSHHNRRNGRRNPPKNPSIQPQRSNPGGPSQEYVTGYNPASWRSGRHSTAGKRGASAKPAPVKASQSKDFWNRPTPSAGNGWTPNGKQDSIRNTEQFDPETQTDTPSPSSFQCLPAELRLKIYAYLFTIYRVEIIRRKSKKTEGTKKLYYRLYSKRLRPRVDKNQEKPGRWWIKSLPMTLIFTCRSIYLDTILLLYANTQFVFATTNAMTRFIKITPSDAQAAIRHVELKHIMYNEPRLTEFRIYKARSDMAFYLACEDMALAFKGLRVLHVDMRIYDWPIRLEIGELWSLPLLFFGRESGTGTDIDEASVRLRMVMFSDEALQIIARGLEERIMGPEKFQIREDERLARKLHVLGRKTKVLRLVM